MGLTDVHPYVVSDDHRKAPGGWRERIGNHAAALSARILEAIR